MKENGKRIDLAIYLNAEDKTVIDRLSGRLTHLPSGRTYHPVHNPPRVANMVIRYTYILYI